MAKWVWICSIWLCSIVCPALHTFENRHRLRFIFPCFFFVFQIEFNCHAFTYLHVLGFYAPWVNFQSVWKYSVVTLYAMFYLSTLSYNFSRCFFAATMSMKHFQFISAFLEFDVRKTREERWKHDKFSCMSYIFDKVNCKFAEVSYFYV